MNKKKSLTAIGPRKAPKQERSRQTFQVILNGARAIIRKDGLKKLSTNRVAEESGVSIGSLYQYFPSKAAIIAALIDQGLHRELEQITQTLESLSPAVGPYEVARTFFSHYYRHEGEDLAERRTYMEALPNVQKSTTSLKFHNDVAELLLKYYETHFNIVRASRATDLFLFQYILKGISLSSVDEQLQSIDRNELVTAHAGLLMELLNIPMQDRGPRP